jgi:glycine/D-amino acid oxidase-like deaminating enzyme
LYSNNFWSRTGVHDLLTIAYLLTGAAAVTTLILPDSVTSSAASRSASIIPFPVRPKPVAPKPEERLTRALESLNAAMADQRAAVAAWRDVLGQLKATTANLDDSLQRYRSNLRSLGTSVSALHAKARSLEQWADSVME